jgi:hypothetical protein
MNKFELLKKYKKAYVVAATGQSYIDSAYEALKVLSQSTKYPIIFYYSDGIVNFELDRVVMQPFRFPQYEFDSEKLTKIYTTIKPRCMLSALKNYEVDEVILLDTDIIATPSIDWAFHTYGNLIENYPIFLRYPWYHVLVDGKPIVSDIISNYIDMNGRDRHIPNICSCMCIANKNCISFLDDWQYYSESDELIKYYYVDNPKLAGQYNDESIANALLQKYNAKRVMDCNLVWAVEPKTVKYSFDFYDGMVGDLPLHPSYNTHYVIPAEYEVPSGLSVLPKFKKDIWGFHGLKKVDFIRESLEIINKRF